MDHLERARADLRRASEQASGPVQTQLDSLQNGIGAEDERETAADGPDSTVDRIAEVAEKLDALSEELENAETRAAVESAVDHLREYLKAHPHGE
ncbi:DUF7553 family protein [Halobacterium wangiae]|uniref:DUF7553 family protein n=1 Tax=Halobacterium wangiae TaxID=2902623 RepID=UPI001E45750B|nr:hypothetical protein [Halobacterium wangiae]